MARFQPFHFLTTVIVMWNTIQVTGEIIIDRHSELTENDELVVEKGTNFSLTCRGGTRLAWAYNHYEPYDGEDGSHKNVEVKEEYGQFVATLTVRDAYFMDTGYFVCYPEDADRYSPLSQYVYVYVKDPDNVLAANNTFDVITKTQGETVDIPCRPTDPSFNVVLMKDEEEVPVPFDPHIGFRLSVESVHQQGHYGCKVNDIPANFALLLHVINRPRKDSIEQPHINITPDSVTEGANITLTCTAHHDIGTTIYLNWTLPNPKMLQSTRIVQNTTSRVSNMNKNQHEGKRLLEIYNVKKQDEGEYTCYVFDNSENQNNNSVTLQVFKVENKRLELNLRGHNIKDVITVYPGEINVYFIVDIIAHPPITKHQWHDNNNKPLIGDENFTINTTNTESKLTIHKPSVESSGTYTLVVSNKVSNRSISVTLQVKGSPILRVNKGKSKDYYLHDTMYEIDCEVFAFPSPTIKWLFTPCDNYPTCNSAPKQIKPSEYYETVVSSLNMLIKSTVRIWTNQTGDLTCRACNELGCNESLTTVLVSEMENGFHVEGPHLVVETDSLVLSCGASKYDYSTNLTWSYYKYNRSLPLRKDIEVLMQETKYSHFIKLNFHKVTKDDSGNYTCSANYRHRRADGNHKTYSMDVKSLAKPVISSENATKWMGQTGSKVVWECKVNGSPPPTIHWYKNDVEVSTVNKSNIKLHNHNQTLVIQVGLDDEATYTCIAINKVDQASKKFTMELTDKPNTLVYMICAYVVPPVLIIAILVFLFLKRRVFKLREEIRELTKAGLLNFEKGNIESLNPELSIGEQADLLPYDKKWEFPRDKLKMGRQLGSGAFGVVMKAEAYELVEPGVATTVAVKMVKRNSDVATIKALVSELKIMIHLGKHLNVVNVLGACTGDLNKRELLVLVEYCQYGNIQNYLLKHRGAFINQVNPRTGLFDPTLILPTSPKTPCGNFFGNGEINSNGMLSMRTSAAFSDATDTTVVMSDMTERSLTGVDSTVQATPIGEDGYLICRDHQWRNSDRGDYNKGMGLKPICTQDLICWSFQIARGMEYLASRKVLHGDLAARNVLLAEDNIVKICDFGFSKSMYRDNNYHKKGDGPLPVKWMALESIEDRVFSTQSDVWAYGVTLWELFSLSCTPYPGMEVDENLFTKLKGGYRMEQPKYATKQLYEVMLDCWHVNPNTRPSFTELAERMGGMLEDTVRSHYVDLNDPFLKENSEYLAQQDYLSMLRSPNYANWTSGGPYTTMKPVTKDSDEPFELTPMLNQNAGGSAPDSPDSSVVTKPIGNNYVNVAQMLSFSNPSYHNIGRPKQSPYVNMPDSADES